MSETVVIQIVIALIVAMFSLLPTFILNGIRGDITGLRIDVKELRGSIDQVRIEADEKIEHFFERLWDRIHKVITDDIDPLRERLERLEREVAVLKSKEHEEGG